MTSIKQTWTAYGVKESLFSIGIQTFRPRFQLPDPVPKKKRVFAMMFLDKCSILTASLVIYSLYTFSKFWDSIYCLKNTIFLWSRTSHLY